MTRCERREDKCCQYPRTSPNLHSLPLNDSLPQSLPARPKQQFFPKQLMLAGVSGAGCRSLAGSARSHPPSAVRTPNQALHRTAGSPALCNEPADIVRNRPAPGDR